MAQFSETSENAESKILLLFFTDKIRMPISSIQLTRIMLEHRFMNYFHLQECLFDLTDKGLLIVERHGDHECYVISEAGEKMLKLFENILPLGTRTHLLEGVSEIRLGLMREMSVSADFILVSEHEYNVKLCITEMDMPLFEAQLSVGSRDDAKLICQNWRENTNFLYPKLISLLLTSSDSEK